MAAEQGSLPNAWPITPDQKAPVHPAIAVDEVAFAGEVVACIIARSAAAARDAVELVDVDYEELPVVLDLEESRRPGAGPPGLGTNKSATWVFDSAQAGTGKPIGEAGLAKAPRDRVLPSVRSTSSGSSRPSWSPGRLFWRPHREKAHGVVRHPEIPHTSSALGSLGR